MNWEYTTPSDRPFHCRPKIYHKCPLHHRAPSSSLHLIIVDSIPRPSDVLVFQMLWPKWRSFLLLLFYFVSFFTFISIPFCFLSCNANMMGLVGYFVFMLIIVKLCLFFFNYYYLSLSFDCRFFSFIVFSFIYLFISTFFNLFI